MQEQTETFKKLLCSLIKRAKAHMEQELERAGLHITPLQYAILAHMSKPGMTLGELSRELANKAPTLIPALEPLEREGYVQKRQDADDGRKIELTITPKGKGVLKKLPKSKSSELLHGGLKALGKEKTQTLLSLLQELTDHIEK